MAKNSPKGPTINYICTEGGRVCVKLLTHLNFILQADKLRGGGGGVQIACAIL